MKPHLRTLPVKLAPDEVAQRAEELARELASGRAALVVEPVPLVDRAVSAALDRIGAQRPQQKAA